MVFNVLLRRDHTKHKENNFTGKEIVQCSLLRSHTFLKIKIFRCSAGWRNSRLSLFENCTNGIHSVNVVTAHT